MEQAFDAKTRKPRNSGIRPGWLLIGSFALMILVGTCLLKLPIVVVEGKHLNWLDALFTSTSAVCVTGLVVENTADFFSRPGQIILMGLIQLGGLGIMTLTFYLVSVMTLRLSFKDRQALGEMISEKHLGLVAGAVRFIVLFTFVVESLGALWLYVLLPESLGGPERVFQACFHSVSAFCNAGFSTFPGGLADPLLEGLTGLQLVITGLVILGGLGAMVLRDGLRYLLARLGWRSDEGGRRLRLHTRVVMMTTGWLLIGGAIAVGLFEFVFNDGPVNGGVLVTSWFHSVTARTAGFNTVDLVLLEPVTVSLLLLLMFVGGSPGGTAGGVRTTVFVVALMYLFNQLRAVKETVVFKRTLPADLGPRALAALILTLGWLFLNYMILRQLQSDHTDTQVLFELVSAFSTVGLSLDVTAELNGASRILIIINMFIGRVGLVMFLMTLAPRGKNSPIKRPVEELTL